jgi:hypothetical protein
MARLPRSRRREGVFVSILRQNFSRAVHAHTWDEALLYANRLNMPEMLRALEDLPPELVDELLSELPQDSTSLPEAVNTARIAFAAAVVKHHAIPEQIPESLAASGQVRDARNFLAELTPPEPRTAGPAVSRAGHLFPTPDAAACAAIDEVLPALAPGGYTYAGYILQIPAGLYLFSKPVALGGGPDAASSPPMAYTVIGVYYARPPSSEETEEELSPEDRSRAIGMSELVFVGVPSGKIVRFTPPDMLPPEDQQAVSSGRTEVLRVASAAPAGRSDRD